MLRCGIMKKVIKSIMLFFLIGIFVWWTRVMWFGLVSNYIPWERSFYWSYSNYNDVLENHFFYTPRNYFMKELPDNTIFSKGFCYQKLRERGTAYALIIEEESKDCLENRIDFYYKEAQNLNTEIIYQQQNEEYLNFVDLKNTIKCANIIDEVILYSERQNEYYGVIVLRSEIPSGVSYMGIVVNDTTSEMIEFSVELPDE